MSSKALQGTGENRSHTERLCLLTGALMRSFPMAQSAVPRSRDRGQSKALAVRWNNNATLDGILASFAAAKRCDTPDTWSFQLRASKTGATLADAQRSPLAPTIK